MVRLQTNVEGENPWKLLRNNQITEALALFETKRAREKPPSYKRGLGEALLWTEQYESAAEHFAQSIEITKKFRMRSEGDYAYLGVARWCLGDFVVAATHWKAGVKAPYAIGGICTQTPLLLLTASVLNPDSFLRSEAEQILRTKLSDPRAGELTEHWPASLGKLAVGTISKEAMAAYWVRTTNLYEVVFEPERQWVTAFYEAVLDLGSGNMRTGEFRRLMRQRTAPSDFSEWELENWMHLVWSPEFYIARFEGRQIVD